MFTKLPIGLFIRILVNQKSFAQSENNMRDDCYNNDTQLSIQTDIFLRKDTI